MYYNQDISQVLKAFSSASSGLSPQQIEESRKTYGENKLYEKKKKSALRIFEEQFRDLLVIILISLQEIKKVPS